MCQLAPPSSQIHTRIAWLNRSRGFLSAAQPTDQGKESVVLLLVVLLVGVGGGTVFVLTMYSFLGCEKEKLCLKRGVKRQNLGLKRGVKKQKLCLKKGCEKAKTWSQKLLDQSYFPIFSSFMNYIPRRRSVKGSLSCFG